MARVGVKLEIRRAVFPTSSKCRIGGVAADRNRSIDQVVFFVHRRRELDRRLELPRIP
jgi:hypothetical protein